MLILCPGWDLRLSNPFLVLSCSALYHGAVHGAVRRGMLSFASCISRFPSQLLVEFSQWEAPVGDRRMGEGRN